MAEIQVTDAQGNTHIFPDGSTPDMIAKALNVKVGAAPPQGSPAPQGSWYDRNIKGTLSGNAGWQQAIDKAAQTEPVTDVGSFMNDLGAGATRLMLSPVAHPAQTAAGLAKTGQAAFSGNPLAMGETFRPAAEQFAQNPSGEAVAAIPQAALAFGPDAAAIAQKGLGRAALLGKTPEAAYESALKPSTTIPAAQRANIVQTGLENAIPVSKAGLEKIGDRIDELNQAIKDQIAADPNRPISPGNAVQNLRSVQAKFANQVNPTSDLAAIDASGQEFLDQFRSQPGGAVRNMTADEAQAMKQGTYRVLAGKYGEQGSAAVEAQKALARGLKEEIATQFPEITKLNKAESQLLDLQPVLERAVNRTGNHQLIGIGTPVAGAAAKAVTGSGGVGAAVGVLKAVLDNPAVKSRLAILVSRGGQIPLQQAAARIEAYSAALGSSVVGSQAYSSASSPNQPAQPQP